LFAKLKIFVKNGSFIFYSRKESLSGSDIRFNSEIWMAW